MQSEQIASSGAAELDGAVEFGSSGRKNYYDARPPPPPPPSLGLEIELLISDTPLPLQEWADEQPEEGMIDLTIHTTAGAPPAPPLEEKSAAQAVAELLALGAGRLSYELLIPVVRMELKGEEEHKDEERGDDHAMLYALAGLFAVATLYLVVRAVRRGACEREPPPSPVSSPRPSDATQHAAAAAAAAAGAWPGAEAPSAAASDMSESPETPAHPPHPLPRRLLDWLAAVALGRRAQTSPGREMTSMTQRDDIRLLRRNS